MNIKKQLIKKIISKQINTIEKNFKKTKDNPVQQKLNLFNSGIEININELAKKTIPYALNKVQNLIKKW